jgi:hypothetical protein
MIWPAYITATRPGLGLYVLEKLKNLGLDGNIEAGRWLVSNEQFGLAGEHHRHQHPLGHTAAQLVGVGAGPDRGVGNTNMLQ